MEEKKLDPFIVEMLDPLVIELMVNRHGLSTQTDQDIVRSIEQEIILAALRIQKKSNRW